MAWMICQTCRTGFYVKRLGVHYCSNRCRQKAYRARKRKT